MLEIYEPMLLTSTWKFLLMWQIYGPILKNYGPVFKIYDPVLKIYIALNKCC